jgi:hypothetical protein
VKIRRILGITIGMPGGNGVALISDVNMKIRFVSIS